MKRLSHAVSIGLIVLLAGALYPQQASAADTYTVTTTVDQLNGNCATDNLATFQTGGLSVREAICLANQDADTDTIIIESASYPLTRDGSIEFGNVRGSLDVTTPIILEGDGTLRQETTDRVMYFLPGSEGSIVREVTFFTGSSTGSGGNVAVSNGGLTIFEQVSNVFGMAVNGGGLAVFNNSTVTLIDSDIRGNDASNLGGGIYLSSGTLALVRTEVSDNTATADGGGVWVNGGTLIVSRSYIAANTAVNGGGIANGPSAEPVTITDSTIASNSASSSGGGLYIDDITYTLSQVTLAYNTATANGGYEIDNTNSGGITADNSLLAGNTPSSNQCDTVGTINLTDRYNLFESGIDCSVYGGPTNVLSTQPVEEILTTGRVWNSPTTPYHRLVAGSDAIDAGDCTSPSDRDQRELIRPIGAACDIGATEYYSAEATYTVTTEADTPDDDTGDLICQDATGECSLLAAYQQAEAFPQVDTIILQEGATYTLTQQGLNFENSITIQGNGATITLDGPLGGVLGFGSFTETTAVVDRVTVTGGTFSGIFVSGSNTLTLTNSVLTGNKTGFRLNPCCGNTMQPTLVNVTITDNTDSGIDSLFDAEVHNSIIWGNDGGSFGAGGFFDTTFSNSSIEGSLPATATDGGGNVNVNPAFFDPTVGDYRLKPGSPLINAGSNLLLPADLTDADGDGNTSEAVPLDLSGVQRVQNSVVDVGAHETNTKPFADVPVDLPAPFMRSWVEYFFFTGITGGCNGGAVGTDLRYCPSDPVTRGAMAVFLLRALNYPNLPHTPAGNPSDPFTDVPSALPAPFMEDWVEEFYTLNITTGCAVDPLRYCPADNVTRGEMAVFILRALGIPPMDDTSNPFADIPDPSLPPSFEAYIETFFALGITTGCRTEGGLTYYCPNDSVTRAEMAVFILRAFDSIPDPDDP